MHFTIILSGLRLTGHHLFSGLGTWTFQTRSDWAFFLTQIWFNRIVGLVFCLPTMNLGFLDLPELSELGHIASFKVREKITLHNEKLISMNALRALNAKNERLVSQGLHHKSRCVVVVNPFILHPILNLHFHILYLSNWNKFIRTKQFKVARVRYGTVRWYTPDC